MVKSVRLTKANRAEEWAKSDKRIDRERALGSTGADHKAAERELRDMVNAKGISYSGDLRARSRNRNDISVRDKHGNELAVEIKHGGGALYYAFDYGVSKLTELSGELCFPGQDYIIYGRKANAKRRTQAALYYRVCKRDVFLDILEHTCGARGHGFQTVLKFSKDFQQVGIQPYYLDKFWTNLQNDKRTMCLWDFCTNILGRDPRWER